MRLVVALAVSAVATAPASSAACRDATGHFAKCPPAAAAALAPSVTKDAKGKCHVASGPKKGSFTKCP